VNEPVRRCLIVTGHTSDGTAVIVSDGAAPQLNLAGAAVRGGLLWARDNLASFPDDGSMPNAEAILPPAEGCRFSTLTIAAGASDSYHTFVTRAMGNRAEHEHPGFHKTPTLDFIVVLDGEFTLEVDRGVERVLRRGDCAVLNGVRHRWHNRGADEATLIAVMLGTRTPHGEYV
jgi:mannose-6-phosphate isomerase-like protein (cupin superfamily)